MAEDRKDLKRSGKKNTKASPLDQYIRHFNYSVFPNFKVYSLSTHPQSNPVASAAAAAAEDNTFPFSDPRPMVQALPPEILSVNDDIELQKEKHEQHKQQHQNLQQNLEQHKKQRRNSSRRRSGQKNEKQQTESETQSPLQQLIVQPPDIEVSTYEGALLPVDDKLPPPQQQATITETLFPPRTTQQESSKSIFFGGWMSHNDESALVLASGPIGDPNDVRNRIRSVALKVRGPVADYQAKNGVPLEQQISFVDLIRMLFVCSQAAVFTILTMLWNLYPLLDGFLYVIRFVLDKTLYVCQGETPTERSYRGVVFFGEMVILLLANLFILNLIVMPISFLILCTMGNCMRLMGLYS